MRPTEHRSDDDLRCYQQLPRNLCKIIVLSRDLEMSKPPKKTTVFIMNLFSKYEALCYYYYSEFLLNF